MTRACCLAALCALLIGCGKGDKKEPPSKSPAPSKKAPLKLTRAVVGQCSHARITAGLGKSGIGPMAEPRAHGYDTTAGRNALVRMLPALRKCAGGASFGSGILELGVDPGGKVGKAELHPYDAAVPPMLRACVVSAVAGGAMPEPPTKRRSTIFCPLALGKAAVVDPLHVEVSGKSISVNGKVVASTIELLGADAVPQTIEAVRTGARLVRGSGRKTTPRHVVVRVDDSVPYKLLIAVTASTAIEGFFPTIYERKIKGRWQPVYSAEWPLVPVARDKAVSILAGADALVVGTTESADRARIPPVGGAPDFAALADKLKTIRRAPFMHGRYDIEIAADDMVSYRHLSSVLIAAKRAGFTEVSVRPRRLLRVKL